MWLRRTGASTSARNIYSHAFVLATTQGKNMSLFACCFWWFVAGILVGWLLSWLYSRMFGRSEVTNTSSTAPRNVAQPLVSGGIDYAAAKAFGFDVRSNEDLIIIEGIGPKIDRLFKDNGVRTFEQVAKMSVDEMQAILNKGGNNFRMANPETWAQQAALCARGAWRELKELQDKLYIGVAPKE
jgi:predicted flap endonuclease-1-like 5' DNA nuclease